MLYLAWPLTDVGRVRSHNEDSYLVDDSLGLYVVADGMGGHAGGAHASRTAVQVVSDVVRRGLPSVVTMPMEMAGQAILELLGAAASEASAAIFDRAITEPALHGMGTTLCGMLMWGDRAYIVHVGDSRAYLLRGSTAQQLTTDHSWLNEQVAAGFLTAEEAATSEMRHIITRSVGFERAVQADLVTVHINPGDAVLLCSDGMCNYIEADELAELAVDNYFSDLPRACVNVALDRGGDDNVTVVVVAISNDQDIRELPQAPSKLGRDTLPP